MVQPVAAPQSAIGPGGGQGGGDPSAQAQAPAGPGVATQLPALPPVAAKAARDDRLRVGARVERLPSLPGSTDAQDPRHYVPQVSAATLARLWKRG